MKAPSSRSRCQLRPSASTLEKAIDSQMVPGAMRSVRFDPVVNASDAMSATSTPKNPVVMTISRVRSSIRRSLPKTVMVAVRNVGRGKALRARRVGADILTVIGAPVTWEVTRKAQYAARPGLWNFRQAWQP